MRPTGNIQCLAPAPWYRAGDSRPHFIFCHENGVFEVSIEDDKLYQNYFNEIIQDLDIKHIVHLRND